MKTDRRSWSSTVQARLSTGCQSTAVSPFHKRPFEVIHAERFVDALLREIQSPEVLALPEHLGSVDQFTDSTDVLPYLDRIKQVF